MLGNLQAARARPARCSTGSTARPTGSTTQKLASQTERSNAEDLDMVQAISDFQNKQSGYDAALKSYAMVQRLSLFQYRDGG